MRYCLFSKCLLVYSLPIFRRLDDPGHSAHSVRYLSVFNYFAVPFNFHLTHDFVLQALKLWRLQKEPWSASIRTCFTLLGWWDSVDSLTPLLSGS
jgi:hypothetical protein